MTYEEFSPASDIADDLEALWRFSVDSDDPQSFMHLIPPDGATNIVIANAGLPQPVAIGPSLRASRIPAFRGLFVAGARLRPGGTWRLTRGEVLDASGLAIGGRSPLAADASAWAEYALEPLLSRDHQAAFRRLASWPFPKHETRQYVAAAARQIADAQGRIQIAMVQTGASGRTLRRHFVQETGMSLREYAMVRRLRHACWLAATETTSLAQTSMAAGYSDQPHFSREMLRLAGTTPRIAIRYLRGISHGSD